MSRVSSGKRGDGETERTRLGRTETKTRPCQTEPQKRARGTEVRDERTDDESYEGSSEGDGEHLERKEERRVVSDRRSDRRKKMKNAHLDSREKSISTVDSLVVRWQVVGEGHESETWIRKERRTDA